jgi:hypothetical protein
MEGIDTLRRPRQLMDMMACDLQTAQYALQVSSGQVQTVYSRL